MAASPSRGGAGSADATRRRPLPSRCSTRPPTSTSSTSPTPPSASPPATSTPDDGDARRRHDPRLGARRWPRRSKLSSTSGATVLGIGIGDDTVRAAYGRSQVVEQPPRRSPRRWSTACARRPVSDHRRGRRRTRGGPTPRNEQSSTTKSEPEEHPCLTPSSSKTRTERARPSTSPSPFRCPRTCPTVEIRLAHIPEPDPYYVDLGHAVPAGPLEQVRTRSRFTDTPSTWRCAATWAPARTTTSSSSPRLTQACPTTGSL